MFITKIYHANGFLKSNMGATFWIIWRKCLFMALAEPCIHSETWQSSEWAAEREKAEYRVQKNKKIILFSIIRIICWCSVATNLPVE
jgi:hypothetical protein